MRAFAFALVHLPLCFCGSAKACRTAWGMLNSLLCHALQAAAANTKSWISRTAGHPRAQWDRVVRPTLFATYGPGGSSAGHRGGAAEKPRRAVGVVPGSLGRGMQADGVWAHLPATTGPIAAVPARGCPGRVATRPAAQSARRCAGFR